MTFSVDESLVGVSRGTPDDWIAWAREAGSHDLDQVALFARRVYALCTHPDVMLKAHFLMMQSAHETSEEVASGAYAPWASEAWSVFNPAGIGVTNNSERTKYDYRTLDPTRRDRPGEVAADVFVAHVWLYVVGERVPDVLQRPRDLDYRWDVAVQKGRAGCAPTLRGFNGTWAWPGTTYAQTIVARLDAFETRLSEGGPAVAEWKTNIPGLPANPLTTNHPVFVQLIPASHTNQRPGIKAGRPRRSVQHGSGNATSTARGEANYVTRIIANSAQVSYHSATDDQETGVFVPLDEVTWQAADGSGPGNMCGASNEMCENESIWADPVRRFNMIDNAANFMGGVAAHIAMETPEQHWTFNFNDPNRHNCPNFLRNRYHNGRRAWDVYAELWHMYKAQELARLGGQPVPTPVPAPGGQIVKGVSIEATKEILARVAPGVDQPVGMVLVAGDRGVMYDGPQTANGIIWIDIHTTTKGSGWIPLSDVKRVEPETSYAKPLPIKALLGTDLRKNDTATGIVTDEANKFIFVADVIEVAVDRLPVLQYASERAPKLRADLVKGERFVGAWLVEAADGKDYYVGCEPSWWRVPYVGTKRVADAPLLPSDAQHV